MSRSRVRERERIRAAVQTTDPAALATYRKRIHLLWLSEYLYAKGPDGYGKRRQ